MIRHKRKLANIYRGSYRYRGMTVRCGRIAQVIAHGTTLADGSFRGTAIKSWLCVRSFNTLWGATFIIGKFIEQPSTFAHTDIEAYGTIDSVMKQRFLYALRRIDKH